MSDEFNPVDKMIRIQGGAQYLQVRDRLIWARHDHPDLSVKTEMLRLDDTIAVFKAVVSYVAGEPFRDAVHVVGTGHGTETPQGFKDYIEKAETVAVGRALGALGYGTADAFEEAEGGKLADAPVAHQRQRASQEMVTQLPGEHARAPIAPGQRGGITAAQMQTITNILVELGIPVAKRVAADVPGKDALPQLTHQEAATMVQQLAKEQALHRAAKREEQRQQGLSLSGSAGDDRHTR